MTDQPYSTNHADPDGVAAAYIAAVEAVDAGTWAKFAAGYRIARKAYGVADALLSESLALALHDMYHRHLMADLLAFEVTTPGEMIEKGELIALDTYDHEHVADALMRDLTRLGGGTDRQGEAATLRTTYLAAMKRAATAADDDVIHAWSKAEAIWTSLASAPVRSAADAAAKVEAVLSWIEGGNAERSDETERTMLRQVVAYLKG